MTVQHSTPVVALPPHTLAFDVYGTPAPQGSKRYVGRMIDDNPVALKGWRDDVKQAALRAMDTTPGWEARVYPAIIASFTFTLARPGYHFGSGLSTKNVLRADAPHLHASKPDLDKLVRSTFDALTSAGAYLDDRRVARLTAVKLYVAHPDPELDTVAVDAMDRPGVRIRLVGVER